MRLGNHERGLLILLLLEILIFSFTGDNFLTWANAGELIRLAVDLGLLALGLTVVIITGGIDLSVGSMMALAAVVFGFLLQDLGLPLSLAAFCALLVGAAGGFLNGFVITR